jgi:hypothetical protein
VSREKGTRGTKPRGFANLFSGILNPQINLRSILHAGKHSVPVIFSGFTPVAIGHFILNNSPSQKALAKNIGLGPSIRLPHQFFSAHFLNEVTARGSLFAAELGPYALCRPSSGFARWKMGRWRRLAGLFEEKLRTFVDPMVDLIYHEETPKSQKGSSADVKLSFLHSEAAAVFKIHFPIPFTFNFLLRGLVLPTTSIKPK